MCEPVELLGAVSSGVGTRRFDSWRGQKFSPSPPCSDLLRRPQNLKHNKYFSLLPRRVKSTTYHFSALRLQMRRALRPLFLICFHSILFSHRENTVFTFDSPTCKQEDAIKCHPRGILGKSQGIFVLEKIAVTLSMLQATFIH